MKYFGLGWKRPLLFTFLLLLVFFACNTVQEEDKEANEEKGVPARIEGKWKAQEMSLEFKGMYKLMEAFKGIYEKHFDGLTLEFKKGGDCVVELKDELKYGEWELRNDSTLILKGFKEEKMAERWHILNLKGNTLRLSTEKKELSMKGVFLKKEKAHP